MRRVARAGSPLAVAAACSAGVPLLRCIHSGTTQDRGSWKFRSLHLAEYNCWADAKLIDAIKHEAGIDIDRDAGLAFASIRGTINHIVLADLVWLLRMTGQQSISLDLPASHTLHFDLREDLPCLWNGPREAWTDAVPGGFEGTCSALQQSSRLLLELCESRPDAWFDEPFLYANSRGDQLEHVPGPVLAHVFNHGTHHRGQVTAVLTAEGAPAPALDLLYFQKPEA